MTNSYDIPFYTAGALFGLSAIASFLAPVAVKYRKQPESPVHIEVLTPIEENDEYEDDEDNQPITMGKTKDFIDGFVLNIFLIVPKIVKTAPSPSSETAPSINKRNGKKEVTQIESVL